MARKIELEATPHPLKSTDIGNVPFNGMLASSTFAGPSRGESALIASEVEPTQNQTDRQAPD